MMPLSHSESKSGGLGRFLGYFLGGHSDGRDREHMTAEERERESREAQLAANRFDSDEIHLLKKTWQDLADRSNGKGIDKETFLQYFPLNGLLGERLFCQFDTRKTGYIDFDGFITGLAKVCRGTIDDKIHFLFDMYDVSHDQTVSKAELSTLLNHIPKEAFIQYNSYGAYPHSVHSPTTMNMSMNMHGGNHMHHNHSVGSFNDREDISTCSGNESDDNTTNPNPGVHPNDAGANEYSMEHTFDSSLADVDMYTNHDMVEKAFEDCDLTHEGRLTYEEFKMWVQRTPLVMDYIESILPYNGPKDAHPHHNKRETLPHMRRMSTRGVVGRSGIPSIDVGRLGARPSSLSLNTIGVGNGGNTSAVSTPMMAGRATSLSLSMPASNHDLNGSSSGSASPMAAGPSLVRNPSFDNNGYMQANKLTRGISVSESLYDSEETARSLLMQAMEVTQNEELRQSIASLLGSGVINVNRTESAEYRSIVHMEAYLWKKGKSMFHMISKRYYLLSGNCMYYYSNKEDIRPRGVIFLTGSIIERIKEEDMQMKGYFGFEIMHQDLCTGEHHRHEKRVLYCKNEEERDKWVTTLQHAAHVVPIEDDYVIGKELGRGRFSIVCECVHKVTNVHCAVKIIDKTTIEPEEKGLLRTEIAVLKLVNHPNIIKMEGLYESKNYIYIVMEMLKGGELFERIVGKPRFTELEAVRLIRPLLESVAYLHDLGIVHRDLKPENILCGEELEDLKIADFGLSKMVLPKEKMDSACGTLSYVAPEVLTMQGYGMEADLWSVGVILFLLLCGKLPFDGEDHNEIIRSTIQADLKVNPVVWNKLSEEARGLITALLNKNPKERITAREALKHPFVATHPHYSMRRASMNGYANNQTPLVTPAQTPLIQHPATTTTTSQLPVNTSSATEPAVVETIKHSTDGSET